MPRLRDVTRMIRSKNAGPFSLTFDIMFASEAAYRAVRDAGILDRRLFAGLFGISENQVRLFNYDPANAIKVTVPRWVVSGDVSDADVFGGQQYAQLVDLEVPGPADAAPR
jgi:hypothetical protein